MQINVLLLTELPTDSAGCGNTDRWQMHFNNAFVHAYDPTKEEWRQIPSKANKKPRGLGCCDLVCFLQNKETF